MAIVSGKTFDNRNYLRTVANWDAARKVWTLPDSATDYIEAIRALPGCIVTLDGDKPAPQPQEPKREPTPFAPAAARTIGDDMTYLNAFDHKNPTLFCGFSSFPAFVDYVAKIPRPSSEDARDSGWTGGYSWTGSQSMDDALSIARNGWKAGVDMAKAALDILQADHVTNRQRTYGIAGGRVNVGKMLSGNPLHMTHRARQPGKKIITLYVQFWMASGIEAEQAGIRAAVVAAISDLLETNGYSTEIIAVGTNTYSNSKLSCQIAVKLKAAGEALSLNDLVFAFGHPSMLRRFAFALASIPDTLRRFWSSMGFQEKAFKDELPPNEFYIGKLDDNVKGVTFADRVRGMFNSIVPDNFPVTLK